MIVAAILLWIILFDLRFHRISHTSLIALFITGYLTNERNFYIERALIALSVGFFAYLFLSLGAGDVKLIFVIILVVVPLELLTHYWIYTAIICLVSVLIYSLWYRSWKVDIPLAPALCGALLWLALSH